MRDAGGVADDALPISRTFKPRDHETELDAQQWLCRQLARARADYEAAGLEQPRGISRTTFADFAYQWLRQVKGSIDHRKNMASQVRSLVAYFGEDVLITEIERHDVLCMVDELEDRWRSGESGGSRGTQTARMVALRGIFSYAVERQVRSTVPTARIRIKRTPHGRAYDGTETFRTPSDAEALAVAEAMPHWLRAAVVLGLYQGWRISEVAGCQMQQIDLLHGRIEVGTVDNGGVLRGHTKSGDRVWQPLTTQVRDALRTHIDTYGPNKSVFIEPSTGRRMSPPGIRREWGSAVAQVGLAQPLPRFHDLRHRCATRFKEKGIPQEFLRHDSIETTQQYWGRATFDDLAEVVSTI